MFLTTYGHVGQFGQFLWDFFERSKRKEKDYRGQPSKPSKPSKPSELSGTAWFARALPTTGAEVAARLLCGTADRGPLALN